MNAKKIMGAVLVALLAAALFVGAGAADTNMGTVFYYEELDGSVYNGTWTLDGSSESFTISSTGGYVDNTKTAGKYVNGDAYLQLSAPTATINAVSPSGNYIVANGGILYQGDNMTITANSASQNVAVESILVTSPNGVPVKYTVSDFADETVNLTTGAYKIQAVFESANMTDAAPATALVSDVIYKFTVVESNKVTITAAADSYTTGEAFAVTITGVPNEDYTYTVTNLDVVSFGTVSGNTTTTNFTMPNTGEAVIYVKAGTDVGTGKFEVGGKTLSIKVIAGTITAKTNADSYYIGNKVTISGTATANYELYLWIEGTNLDLQQLISDKILVSDGTWKQEIDGSVFSALNPDAGTYTVYITTNNTDVTDGTYTTVSLVLKQPFISVTDAPAVAVIGTDYVVTGTAESTDDVMYYIFGTNFFKTAEATVDDGVFEIEYTIKDMAAGQYFMVIQHPMYDGEFNIWANGTEIVTAPTYNKTVDKTNFTILFDVEDRQKTNAAQALCDALDTQNIDDMYVKLSFVVAAQESTINPIPSEITKGSQLTVSGQTNTGAGKLVTVELLSTAFAAQPKETVGSASFISLTTKTNEDGSWEITFDTTGLNVDEYTVTAAVEGLNSATAKINVIEGAPTEQPTTTPTEQPTQTEQPTDAPTTPGFGALAALAGLGAVAVLLLRRE